MERNKIRSENAQQILKHFAPQTIYTQVQRPTVEILDEKVLFGSFHNFKRRTIFFYYIQYCNSISHRIGPITWSNLSEVNDETCLVSTYE